MSYFAKTQIKDQYGFTGDATPNSEIITTDKIRLVGAIFNGSTFDTNFWTKGILVNGTVAQTNSEIIVTSGAAAADYAGFYSLRRANWVSGTSNKFRAQMRLQAAADNDLVRRWGVGWAATITSTAMTDGAWFLLEGTALSVVTAANDSTPTTTTVASGAFNGTYTAPTWMNNNTFEILYTLGKVYFLINNTIIHTATFSTDHWTANTTNFHAFADANTIGDGSTAKTMTIRMMNITRLGKMLTMPIYKYITGVTTAQVLKYGGGIIHSITIGTSVANKKIDIYDDTAGSAGQMVAITLPAGTDPFTLNLECPFFSGLTVTPNDTGLKITVVYE